VGVAIDDQDILGAGGVPDVMQRLLGEGDVLPIVFGLGVLHPRDGNSDLVGDL
jgi:hypothetical protein